MTCCIVCVTLQIYLSIAVMNSTRYSRILWSLVVAAASTIHFNRAASTPPFSHSNYTGSAASQKADISLPTLYLLSLLPRNSAATDTENGRDLSLVWNQGPSVYLAGEIAIELINNSSDILDGYSLELLQGDSGCNLAVSRGSVEVIDKLFYNGGKQVLGVAGPGCSAAGLFVSKFISTEKEDISLLTLHLGGSPLFDARLGQFPYSFSMLSHTDTVAMAIIEVMKHSDWNDVVVLYDESQIYFTTLLERFVELNAMGKDSSVPVTSLIFEDYIPFNDIRMSEKRIILLLVGSNLISRILCVSFRNGFVFPEYQWMFVTTAIDEFTSVSTFYGGKPVECGYNYMLDTAQQSLFIEYHFEPVNKTKYSYFGLTYAQIMQKYNDSVKSYNYRTHSSLQPSIWGPAYFDTIWAMALALNNSILELRSKNLELAEFEYGQKEVTKVLRKHLLELSFEGVSGTIEFNRITGFVNRSVDIMQLQEHKLKSILLFNGTHLLQTGTSQLVTIEDSFGTRVPLWTTVLILLTTMLILVLLIGLHCSSLVFRGTPSVKASSLKIIQVAYIGCYLTIIGIVCESIAAFLSSHHRIKCRVEQASFSVLLLGMTLIVATICVRTWRLYRIFVHFVDPGKLVANKYLFIFICFCIVLELPVVLVWGIADPIQPKIIINSRWVYCTSNYSLVWFLALLFYNAIILLFSCYFSLRTLCNKIPQRDFKSNSILNLAYVLTLELTIGITMYVLFQRTWAYDPLPEYLIKNITSLLCLISCCLLLFLPPILPLLNFKRKSGPDRPRYNTKVATFFE